MPTDQRAIKMRVKSLVSEVADLYNDLASGAIDITTYNKQIGRIAVETKQLDVATTQNQGAHARFKDLATSIRSKELSWTL